MNVAERSYWVESRSHRYSLVFALPLLLLYELLAAIAPVRAQGGVIRNGADVGADPSSSASTASLAALATRRSRSASLSGLRTG